jgi:short-subunit dehydrogenase
MSDLKLDTLLWAAGAVSLAYAASRLLRRRGSAVLQGQVALITGGSRGLGLLLARSFAREGCKIAICARDEQELERAREDLSGRGAQVLTQTCDLTQPDEIGRLVDAVTGHFGRVDILVNNAGIIQVGPLANMRLEDFEQAMNVMFWGPLRLTLAVLPQMLERKSGRIVNITSIGGKVSVPHLLPYCCAKFAAVALSEGLRAELSHDGVMVTTIAPGLMRTGSHVNAEFKGDQDAEATWFGLGATLPLVSMNAEDAAHEIVEATKRGEAERILSAPASALARLHGLFPGLTADLLGLVNQVLPSARAGGERSVRGKDVQPWTQSRLLHTLMQLGTAAAARFNEQPSG